VKRSADSGKQWVSRALNGEPSSSEASTPDLSLPLAYPMTLTGGPRSHLVKLMDAAILIRDRAWAVRGTVTIGSLAAVLAPIGGVLAIIEFRLARRLRRRLLGSEGAWAAGCVGCRPRPCGTRPRWRDRCSPLTSLCVLGSGGRTPPLIRYNPRERA